MTREAHTQTMTTAQESAERELKFAADPETFKVALALPLLGGVAEAAEWLRLKSVYFDTEDGDLMRHGVTLRVRRAEGAYIMGLKRVPRLNRGFFDRDELEVKSPSAAPDLSLFDEATAKEIKEIIGEKPLARNFGSDIRRVARSDKLCPASGARGFDRSGGDAHRRPAQRVDHEGGVEAADAMAFEQFADRRLAQRARLVRRRRRFPEFEQPFGAEVALEFEQDREVAPELLAQAVDDAVPFDAEVLRDARPFAPR